MPISVQLTASLSRTSVSCPPQVDTQREVVLVPIYGVMVPFHILTIKNATNNQARFLLAACSHERMTCDDNHGVPTPNHMPASPSDMGF